MKNIQIKFNEEEFKMLNEVIFEYFKQGKIKDCKISTYLKGYCVEEEYKKNKEFIDSFSVPSPEFNFLNF